MGKLTYPSLFGLEKARAMAQDAAKCLAALEGLPVRSQVLRNGLDGGRAGSLKRGGVV